MPVLRDYALVNWVRIKGGVYFYIEKILERFKGDIRLNVEIANIFRSADAVKIVLSDGEIQAFDKVVFAMPPDRVMRLLSDPTDAETKRFSAWKANYATVEVHGVSVAEEKEESDQNEHSRQIQSRTQEYSGLAA